MLLETLARKVHVPLAGMVAPLRLMLLPAAVATTLPPHVVLVPGVHAHRPGGACRSRLGCVRHAARGSGEAESGGGGQEFPAAEAGRNSGGRPGGAWAGRGHRAPADLRLPNHLASQMAAGVP